MKYGFVKTAAVSPKIRVADTELLCFGEKAKDVARSAFQLSPDMEHIVLKGLVSRKKQLIPSIVTVLQQ